MTVITIMNPYSLSVITHPVEHKYLADASGTSSDFLGKSVTKEAVENNIIQIKIRQLKSEGRSYTFRKLSDRSSTRAENKEEKAESEPSPDKRICLHNDDKVSDNISDIAALLYTSKGEKYNFNCVFYRNNELVVCSHLTHCWLAKDKFKYGDIASETLIKECRGFRNTSELIKEFIQNKCPSEGIYFEVNKFQEAIYRAATTLTKGHEKKYLLSSTNHAMGLCLKKNNDDNIVLYYYDPNDTLRHRKIIVKDEDSLKNLRYYDFWDHKDIATYFKRHDAAGCLVTLDTKGLQKDCKVVCMARPSAGLMYILCENGHYGHSAVSFNFEDLNKPTLKQFIPGKSEKGVPALHIACQNGHIESVNALLETICNSNFNITAKAELLSGESEDGTPALYIACQNGHDEAVTALLKMVSSLNVALDVKKVLIAGKTENGSPALYIACLNGHNKTVKALLKTVYSLNLALDEKKEFIAGKNNGIPALYIACQNGCFEVVTTLLSAMCSSDFNNTIEAELLAGKSKDGTPALYIACQFGHNESVKTLLETICNSNFKMTVKTELLASKDEDSISALYIACCMGHHQVVKVLLEAMCDSDLKLDMTVLEELMTAKNTYTQSPLFVALEYGHTETVKVFLNAVLSSPLDFDAKERLLTAKTQNGLSALQMAIDEGKMDAVNVFVEIVENSNALHPSEKYRLIKPYNDYVQGKEGAINITDLC